MIIPSFLRSGPKRKLHPTSYLDGLRGVAAFFVMQVSKEPNSKHRRSFYLIVLQDHLLRDARIHELAVEITILLFSPYIGFVLSHKCSRVARLMWS